VIYMVDEDLSAFGAWISELQLRKHTVKCLWNANEAFNCLCEIGPMDVQLVVIDVMLAVEDVDDERFSPERTDGYQETGLCLLDELVDQNPSVFPKHAVLLTNTVSERTLKEARKSSTRHQVPLWKKATISSPVEFGDRVEARIQELA
jgi:hypothetical protein